MIEKGQIYKRKPHPDLAAWQAELRYEVVEVTKKFVWVICMDCGDNYHYKIQRKEFENFLELGSK